MKRSAQLEPIDIDLASLDNPDIREHLKSHGGRYVVALELMAQKAFERGDIAGALAALKVLVEWALGLRKKAGPDDGTEAPADAEPTAAQIAAAEAKVADEPIDALLSMLEKDTKR